ncbi:MAG: DNA polymerase domain-containing protein [Firmicutes bacterium]|jgi:bifunctional non-homologous end joining protein LigD|nr:DNA polymerase domain-containing protein [Bacillota bacterium]
MTSLLETRGKKITLTNLKKELWPGEGITKYHLIKYYLEVSAFMLPHLENRFLVIQRFPEGIHRPGFFQKNIPEGAPSWLKTAVFQGSEKETRYLLCSDPETLAWLGNQACLEIHPWLSSRHTPEKPDYAVFDLDPPQGVSFRKVCLVALVLHKILKKKGLKAYPKTSGSRGIQVYLPLKPVYSYEQVRDFTAAVFKIVENELPDITTTERKVSMRGGKIYLDHLQNARGKTLVAPYSPRPLKGAPVSAPLLWEELTNPSLIPSSFTIHTILPRLRSRGELFAPVLHDRQEIPKK